MNLAGKILCRTVGTVGMGLALYDASKVGGLYARNGGQYEQAKYLERRYFDSRTTDHVSYRDSKIGEKTFDLCTKNPLPKVWGKIRGGIGGFLYGLGNSLPIIVCSSMALLCKNVGAKIGVAGIALGMGYKILREGFGVGKQHPMN